MLKYDSFPPTIKSSGFEQLWAAVRLNCSEISHMLQRKDLRFISPTFGLLEVMHVVRANCLEPFMDCERKVF